MAEVSRYAELTLEELLEEVASSRSVPAGGSVAAVCATLAAALATMCARLADGHWEHAAGAVAQAESLRSRLAPMAERDAEAYLAALATMGSKQPDERQERRDFALGQALALAADAPLEIAEAAGDVAELAASVAEFGNPNVQPDAASAACIAAACVRATVHLVEINLATQPDDERVNRGRRALEAAEAASRRALAAGR